MISYSSSKINLGLNVTDRREDGYHDLETLFVEVKDLTDIVEVCRVEESDQDVFEEFGIKVDCDARNNLCVKALNLMREEFGSEKIGATYIGLCKRVPMGAGMGGGSANAVEVVRLLNKVWGVGMSNRDMEVFVAKLGSDTSFFVNGGMAYATGRGEVLSPYAKDLGLQGKYLLLAKPDLGVSTAQAFSGISPMKWDKPLLSVLDQPIESWRNELKNDFETTVFEQIPYLGQLKKYMYDQGALYASMSGSGSTVYGLFDHKPDAEFEHYFRCVRL